MSRESIEKAVKTYANFLKHFHDEAVGAMALVLDCGCLMMRAFSADRKFLGRLGHIEVRLNGSTSLGCCSICRKEEETDLDRVVDVGFVWFEPVPDRRTRQRMEETLLGEPWGASEEVADQPVCV